MGWRGPSRPQHQEHFRSREVETGIFLSRNVVVQRPQGVQGIATSRATVRDPAGIVELDREIGVAG